MILECFAGFVMGTDRLFIAGVSIILAISLFLFLKNQNVSTKQKIGLIYGHLFFIFLPFVIMTTNTVCSVAHLSCSNNIVQLIGLALPTTFILSVVASFFVIPGLYMFFSRKNEMENIHIKKFIQYSSNRMSIKLPKIYVIDNANPIAFSFKSFRSMIFMSAGLIDILNKKEIESVLLHELWHLKRKSSILTTSFSLLRVFSPLSLLARFHHDSYKEESYADRFAIRTQKTDRHLKSAKRKIDEFERNKNISL